MADDILKELLKLETLAGPSRSSSSSKGKSAQSLNATLASLEESIELAERQIRDGVDPESVLASLVKQTEKGKGDVEKGLKEWYGGLSKVGKAIDKVSRLDLPARQLISMQSRLRLAKCTGSTLRTRRHLQNLRSPRTSPLLG